MDVLWGDLVSFEDESIKTVAFDTNEALRVEPPATSSMSAPEMLTLSDSLLLLFVANEARVRRGETGREARRSGVDNPVDPLNVTSVGLKM